MQANLISVILTTMIATSDLGKDMGMGQGRDSVDTVANTAAGKKSPQEAVTATGRMISIHQQSGSIQAYLGTSQAVMRYNGAVIIAHELWGLTNQIKRVADRLAASGYMALAPDLFSTDTINRQPSDRLQKELSSPDERVRYNAMPKLRAMIAPTQTPQFKLFALSRLESCFEYMYNQPLVHQRVVLLGFGLGATYAFEMAMREQRLRGVVAFYGQAPKIRAELEHIRCPILAFYGSKETSLMNQFPLVLTRMLQAGVDFNPVIYEQAGHAFFNDENSFSYDAHASDAAWGRMLSFMRENTTI